MNIRIANEFDFESVKRITQTTIKAVYPKYYPSGAVQFFCDHHSDEKILEDIKANRVYLIENEENEVGTVTICGNEINRLFVLTKYQHMGYGRALMDFAEKMISKETDTSVLDASLPAKKIYLLRGYKETAYNIIKTDNGDYLCFDVMERHVGGKE